MLTLHSYQSATVSSAIDVLIIQNSLSVLIQSATGSGKTVIAAGLIQQLLRINPSYKFLIVVPSMTLVEQFYKTLSLMGLPASVLHNSLKADKDGNKFNTTHRNIVITMPDTFAGVVAGKSELRLPTLWNADFLVMDEAHKNTAASSQAAKNHFNCKIIGLTATPRREQNKDGEHLWDWYEDRMIVAATIKYLIQNGYIVKPTLIRKKKNDVIVTDWLNYTKGESNKRTIVVSTEVKFAEKLAKAFIANKVRAQLIEGTQTMAERQRYFKAFEEGYIDVLCSVDSLCEGFDCKPAKYLVIDRNMVSIALMHQCAGRVLRAFAGKTTGYIYDYGNNLELDNIENKMWTPLDYAPNVTEIAQGVRISSSVFAGRKLAYTCEAVNDNDETCYHVYDAAKNASCAACGTKTDFKCVTTPREVLTKICGAANIELAVWRGLKAQVKNAYNSLVIKQRELKLSEIGAFFFQDDKLFDASHYGAYMINEMFARDLNLDDPIEFCPFTQQKAVDLLAA